MRIDRTSQASSAADVDDPGGDPVTSNRTANRGLLTAKILIDRISAAVALVVLSPIIGATALGIRLSMGSPVVFRQVRAGR